MTNVSPQIQAVLDAYEQAYDGDWVKGVWIVNERTMLAAAFRVAASQLRNAYANEECVDNADDYLDDIANELEKTND
jgi:hypothetical protein